jgi:transketolase
LNEANENDKQPSVIVMATIKGKGVSFMENNIDFHGVAPNEMEYKLAMRELNQLEEKYEASL